MSSVPSDSLLGGELPDEGSYGRARASSIARPVAPGRPACGFAALHGRRETHRREPDVRQEREHGGNRLEDAFHPRPDLGHHTPDSMLSGVARRDIDRLQDEIQELFADLWQVPRFAGLRRGLRPEVDSYRTDDPPRLIVVVEVAGVDPDEIRIMATADALVVSGERRRPKDPAPGLPAGGDRVRPVRAAHRAHGRGRRRRGDGDVRSAASSPSRFPSRRGRCGR